MGSYSRKGKKPNEEGCTIADVKAYYVEKIIENGYAKTKKEAGNILIEALFRNVVIGDVLESCEFISQESN